MYTFYNILSFEVKEHSNVFLLKEEHTFSCEVIISIWYFQHDCSNETSCVASLGTVEFNFYSFTI